MSPGAHLSHATRIFADAQRAVFAGVVHLELADASIPNLDTLLPEHDLQFTVAELLFGLGEVVVLLQRLADAYANREAERAFAGRAKG